MYVISGSQEHRVHINIEHPTRFHKRSNLSYFSRGVQAFSHFQEKLQFNYDV